MGKELSAEAIPAIRKALDDACADQNEGLAGVSLFIANKEGKQLFAHASGKRGHGSEEPLTLDSVFWIASFTKLVTAIACMQLVEQGKLALDDADQLEELCPELKDVKVMQEDGTLVPKNKRITLRMLLTHTAGFSYTLFRKRLRKQGFYEFSANISDIVNQPLVHQPGEIWEYGISLDWAGIVVERASGMNLNDYFHKNIFEPLGLKDITFLPSEEMKEKLAYMNQRSPEGVLSRRDHPMLNVLNATTEEEKKSLFFSGGGGLFAKPQDYTQILATLLSGGTSPVTGKQILKQSTVDSMFQNQLPHMPNFARVGMNTAIPELSNSAPELYPIPDGGPQGWGLSFLMTYSVTGRSADSGQWGGLPNLFWWCDREKEIAGVIATQVLPFGDPKLLPLWFTVEAGVYAALQEGK